MPRDMNINISVSGGNRRNAFGGGNLSKSNFTLNSNMNSEQPSGDEISTNNLKKLFSIGFFFQKAQQANEIVGAYTNNRLRQRKFQTSMTFTKYSIGIAKFGPLGVAYAGGDMAYRGIMYGIEVDKKNREAQYYTKLSGNNANSGSRYRGNYQ